MEEANTGKGLKIKSWMKPIFKYFVPAAILFIYIYGMIKFPVEIKTTPCIVFNSTVRGAFCMSKTKRRVYSTVVNTYFAVFMAASFPTSLYPA